MSGPDCMQDGGELSSDEDAASKVVQYFVFYLIHAFQSAITQNSIHLIRPISSGSIRHA